MTKSAPMSIFALAFLCIALLGGSCSRIAPNARSLLASRVTSQSVNLESLSQRQFLTCQSNADCADPLVCLDETIICENPPCDGFCVPKVNLCNCDVPCSGNFEGFQCFEVKRNGDLFSNICLNPDDGSVDFVTAADDALDIEPLACDASAGGNDEGSDDVAGEDDTDASDGSDSSDDTDDSDASGSDGTEGTDEVDGTDDADGAENATGTDEPDGTDDADDVDDADDADDDNSSDGDEGNETASPTDTSDSSEGTNETGDDTSEPVCIDASMLTNFASHELVFEKHVLAHVLCDMAGSCATRGHMVIHKEKAMMMKSYCEIVGCDEKIMMVNSPRYQRGLKVKSKSEDMHFTAFAARYETRGEEMVLSVAARYGF